MYVCVCKAVTEKDLQKAINEGARTVRELKEKLKVTESCGTCLESVQLYVKEVTTSEAA